MSPMCDISVRSRSIEMTQKMAWDCNPKCFFQKQWLRLQSQAFFLVYLGFDIKLLGFLAQKTL